MVKGTVAPYLDMAALPTSGFSPNNPVIREFTSWNSFPHRGHIACADHTLPRERQDRFCPVTSSRHFRVGVDRICRNSLGSASSSRIHIPIG